MGLGTSSVGKLAWEVNAAIEAQRAIIEDVDVKSLEVGRGIDDADLTGLHEIIGDDDVFLVWRDLDVVGTNGWLDLIRVIQTLDVVEVADIQGGNVVGGGQGEVSKAAVE